MSKVAKISLGFAAAVAGTAAALASSKLQKTMKSMDFELDFKDSQLAQCLGNNLPDPN